MVKRHKTVSASSIISNGSCVFHGVMIGTDGTNDPAITIYDNTTNSGGEVLPTCTYDASVLGLNGTMLGEGILCSNGLYCEITIGGGACEVTVYYS